MAVQNWLELRRRAFKAGYALAAIPLDLLERRQWAEAAGLELAEGFSLGQPRLAFSFE